MRAPQRRRRPPMTTTRREFLGATLAGIAFVGCDLMAAAPVRAQGSRRAVTVRGKRVKTVDVHAHCAVAEAMTLMGLTLGAQGEALRSVASAHPQGAGIAAEIPQRLNGNGFLDNVIGNPLETAPALSHLIFEGTLDRFPGLKICGAHGGGYLPSYAARSDRG